MSDSELDLPIKGENEPKDSDKRVYELGYLLVPTIASENVPASYSSLKDLVVSFGGEVIADEIPKNIQLAYTITKVVTNVRTKYNSAYFGWIKFFMDPEKVLELKKKVDLSPEVMRFLLLKTVKENTIATKRFVGRDSAYRRPSATHKTTDTEEAAPINKEEIDKEIDAMVAV
ncbi:MAG: 30S ribosomal protein S6 [Patescibacteria group bacterium]